MMTATWPADWPPPWTETRNYVIVQCPNCGCAHSFNKDTPYFKRSEMHDCSCGARWSIDSAKRETLVGYRG